jgi:hypothetical protein
MSDARGAARNPVPASFLNVNKLEKETERLRKISAEGEGTTQSHKSLARQLSNMLVDLRLVGIRSV